MSSSHNALSKSSSEKLGVLVVEDDRDLREALQTIFEMEGIPVSLASNGQEALDLLTHPPYPSVIILDLMMPIMNGWEFLEQRRLRKELREIPVILSSAFTTELPDDVEATLKKPADIDLLLKTVLRHMHP